MPFGNESAWDFAVQVYIAVLQNVTNAFRQ